MTMQTVATTVAMTALLMAVYSRTPTLLRLVNAQPVNTSNVIPFTGNTATA
jgi:hypothetical protein